jgi:hypothetical protein
MHQGNNILKGEHCGLRVKFRPSIEEIHKEIHALNWILKVIPACKEKKLM